MLKEQRKQFDKIYIIIIIIHSPCWCEGTDRQVQTERQTARGRQTDRWVEADRQIERHTGKTDGYKNGRVEAGRQEVSKSDEEVAQ